MRKRFLAIAALLAIAVACLSSCGLGLFVTTEEVLAAADAALAEGGYTATSTTELSAVDPELADRIEEIESADITFSTVGDDFKARMSVTLGDASVYRSYTVKDGVLYVESLAAVGEESMVTKKKSEIDEAQLAELISEIGAGAELTHEDFETITRDGLNSTCTITCKDVKAESLEGAEDILGSAALGAGFEVTLKDATYVVLISEGRYEKTTLTYTYSVEADGALYNMTATLITEYEYDSELTVNAPDDVDAYKATSYENVLK